MYDYANPTNETSAMADIGGRSLIDPTAIIGHNVTAGKGCQIEALCVVGYDNQTRVHDKSRVLEKLELGDGVLIRTHAVLYRGSKLGDEVKVGHGALLREGMEIGDRTAIGNHVSSEGYTKIGADCVIHAGSHLTAFMEIGDKVFFGPGVITMNDPKAAHFRPHLEREIKGPTIRFGARIGAGAKIGPGVTIGENAVIGFGAVVTKDVGPRETWVGSPARKIADVPLEEVLKAVG